MSEETWKFIQYVGIGGLGYLALWLSFKRKWVWYHEMEAKDKAHAQAMAEKITDHARQLAEKDKQLAEKDVTIQNLSRDRDRLLVVAIRQASATKSTVSVLETVLPVAKIPEIIGEEK